MFKKKKVDLKKSFKFKLVQKSILKQKEILFLRQAQPIAIVK